MRVALQKKKEKGQSDVKQMYVSWYHSTHSGAKPFHCFKLFERTDLGDDLLDKQKTRPEEVTDNRWGWMCNVKQVSVAEWMEEEEIMREVGLGVDYGMAICHHQIIIPPRDKWRMEAARALACLCYNGEGKDGERTPLCQHRWVKTDRL